MDVIWLYPSVEMRLCSTRAGHSFWYSQSRITHHLDATAAMPHNALVNVPILTIVETSIFARRAEKLLSSEEHEELLFYLALHPLSGDEVPGTGGVRKVRFAARGKGKSGGVRVIYYFFDEENPLYAIFLYGKNEQANLTPEQKREVASYAATIKAGAKMRRIRE